MRIHTHTERECLGVHLLSFFPVRAKEHTNIRTFTEQNYSNEETGVGGARRKDDVK